MTEDPPRERWIDYGLAVAFVAALVAALAFRTPRIPPDAPRLTLRTHPLAAGIRFGYIDALEHGGVDVNLTAAPIHVRSGEVLQLKGWAVDPATGLPPGRVIARIDDQPPASGPVDAWRPDVGAALADPLANLSGYRVELPAGPPGRHRLTVVLQSRGRLIPIAPALQLEVDP